jgi:hypothetical protein
MVILDDTILALQMPSGAIHPITSPALPDLTGDAILLTKQMHTL